MGLYSRAGAMIIIRLIRPNTAFLSALSLNHLCLVYIGESQLQKTDVL